MTDHGTPIPVGVGTDRLPDPGAGFVWETDGIPVLRPDADGVRAAFTARVGGVSLGSLAELNLSLSVGDDEDRVLANRDLASRTIGRDVAWSTIRQVHGTRVVPAAAPPNREEADAVWTDDPTRTIAVLAADCVPLLLARDRTVAAVHAGWRGLVAGVVEAGAAAIRARAAWAGPAIGPCCFEVGGDVVEAFHARFGEPVVADERHVDLWRAAELAALDAGAARFHAARICTSCHPAVFFSHRRDRGRTGRQALIAAAGR